jgi:hypothetical protein
MKDPDQSLPSSKPNRAVSIWADRDDFVATPAAAIAAYDVAEGNAVIDDKLPSP